MVCEVGILTRRKRREVTGSEYKKNKGSVDLRRGMHIKLVGVFCIKRGEIVLIKGEYIARVVIKNKCKGYRQGSTERRVLRMEGSVYESRGVRQEGGEY